MNKFFFTLTLFMIFLNSNSQINSKNKFFIYTSPLKTLDYISRPMINFGAEYIFFEKIGLSGAYAYRYIDDFTGRIKSNIVNSIGYSYALEVKYYDLNIFGVNEFKNYMSIEYRYIVDDYNSQFYYIASDTSYTEILDEYGIQKDIHIGNIKYGFIMELNKYFYTDLYGGIGFRSRNVKNIERDYNEDLGHRHSSPERYWVLTEFEESSGTRINLALGIKIGIKF